MRPLAPSTTRSTSARVGGDGVAPAGHPGAGSRRPAVGRHDELEARQRLAWTRYQDTVHDAPSQATIYLHQHRQIAQQREDYLRALLGLLPFRWHSAVEPTTGDVRVVLDEDVDAVDLRRSAGDTLASNPTSSSRTASERLPTSAGDLRIAEQVVVQARTGRAGRAERPRGAHP